MRKIKTPKPAITATPAADIAVPAIATKPTIDLAAKLAASTLASTVKYLSGATYPVGKYTNDNANYLAFFASYAKTSPVLSIAAFNLAHKSHGLNVPNYTVKNFQARARLLCGLQLTTFCDINGVPQSFENPSNYFKFAASIVTPSAAENRPVVLEAITAYKAAIPATI